MQKVIFFTAGTNVTPAEQAALAELLGAQYYVAVRNGAADPNYSVEREQTDFVAGTVPDAYSDVDVWTPGGDLPSGTAAVSDADAVNVSNSGFTASASAVAAVTGNTLSAAVLPATVAIAKGADAITIADASGTTAPGTLNPITAGALAGAKITAATSTINKQGDGINLQNSAGAAQGGQVTMQVAGGVAVGARMAATTSAVTNGQALTVPVTGTYTDTATVAVANGVVTGITLS